MDLTALTLTQLFTRQAQINADHEVFIHARNACAPGSFDWDLQNAAATGSMQDLADTAREITRRITQAAAAAEAEHEPPTHVPMVCTACRKPVESVSAADWWTLGADGFQHTTDSDAVNCPASGSVVMAMVAAGNESVPRNA